MPQQPRRGTGRGSARYRAQQRGPSSAVWMLGAVGLAILILVVVRFALPRNGPGSKQDGQPVAPSVLTALTTVPASAFDHVGVGPTKGTGKIIGPAGGTTTPWKDASGKPVFMYVGAEYCPYCAATRWALVTGLSRFGTFKGLEYMTSSPTDVYPDTPTFTFLHASYASSYIDFQPVEEEGPIAGQPLQSLNTQQAAYRAKYEAAPYFTGNTPGSYDYPFLDVANRYLWQGSLYDPQVLAGQLWPALSQAVHSGQGTVAQTVLGGANVISAAICAVDGGQPASVCQSAGVKAAAATLPAAQG